MQQSWHNESQKFMDQIVSLEVENQRLKLLQENSSTGSAINDGESHQTLSDLVSGKQIQRPPSLAIRTEVNAFQTEGQAQVLQESKLSFLLLSYWAAFGCSFWWIPSNFEMYENSWSCGHLNYSMIHRGWSG